MKSVSHIILATLLSTGAAVAQDKVDFDRLDANGDGYLSNAEWSGADYVAVEFNTLDTNRDGRLDRNEVQAGMQSSQQGDTQRASSQQSSDRQDNMQQGMGQTQPIDAQQTGTQEIGSEQTGTQEIGTQGTSTQETGTGQTGTEQTGSQQMGTQQIGTQQAGSQSGGDRQSFQQADTDRDSRVSRTEAQGAGYDFVVVEFDTLDTNRDNYLDENEWNQGMDTNMQEDTRVNTETDDLYLNGTGEQDTRFETSTSEGDDGQAALREDFNRHDVNEDGYLDEEEVTESDWVDINLFEKSDVNDDGLIDIGEAEDGFMEWGNDESVIDADEEQ